MNREIQPTLYVDVVEYSILKYHAEISEHLRQDNLYRFASLLFKTMLFFSCEPVAVWGDLDRCDGDFFCGAKIVDIKKGRSIKIALFVAVKVILSKSFFEFRLRHLHLTDTCKCRSVTLKRRI